MKAICIKTSYFQGLEASHYRSGNKILKDPVNSSIAMEVMFMD